MTMDSSLSVGFDGVLMIFVEAVFSFCKTKEEVEWNGNEITTIQAICCSKPLSCRTNSTAREATALQLAWTVVFQQITKQSLTRKSRWSGKGGSPHFSIIY